MPAHVVVVHDDLSFLDDIVSALQRADYDVVGFSDSMAALSAIENARRVDVLVTRVKFPEGTPHGVALALMARTKQPGIKVLFTARPDMAPHTEDVGEVLVAPVTAETVLAKVREMLAEPTRLDPEASVRRSSPAR